MDIKVGDVLEMKKSHPCGYVSGHRFCAALPDRADTDYRQYALSYAHPGAALRPYLRLEIRGRRGLYTASAALDDFRYAAYVPQRHSHGL